MRRVVISAGRRGLAGLVLILAVFAALDSALFKVWHSSGSAAKPEIVNSIHHLACTPATCYSTRPGWAIPMAIAIGLAGMLVAALIYRPRSTTR
jgi:hypothetical protein